jgi:hypothetical protein
MRTIPIRTALALAAVLAVGRPALADDASRDLVQIVALDECDPDTFNTALGPDFCRNVALAKLFPDAVTKFDDLVNQAGQGNPPAAWDFEPDDVMKTRGSVLSVVNQGGEPHTFTEVAKFGGGFVPALNHGEATVPECDGGFSNLAVARTRILQGSHLEVTGLAKGKHHFQCCIHPWMHVDVEVK